MDNNFGDFYPRSPCGERRFNPFETLIVLTISIHALLAESDAVTRVASTPTTVISIHALLAESDVMDTLILANAMLFLSTLSLRRATSCTSIGRPKRLYFYPRSPCGERHGYE